MCDREFQDLKKGRKQNLEAEEDDSTAGAKS